MLHQSVDHTKQCLLQIVLSFHWSWYLFRFFDPFADKISIKNQDKKQCYWSKQDQSNQISYNHEAEHCFVVVLLPKVSFVSNEFVLCVHTFCWKNKFSFSLFIVFCFNCKSIFQKQSQKQTLDQLCRQQTFFCVFHQTFEIKKIM